jgi:hypothetical protein
VKLFKVEANPKGDKLKLVDSRYFNNRDGFGFLHRNLTKGNYQIHFKKYSTGFDVFDFTVKILSNRHFKIQDEDSEETKNVKLTKEMIDKIPQIKKGQIEEIMPGKPTKPKGKKKISGESPIEIEPEDKDKSKNEKNEEEAKKKKEGQNSPAQAPKSDSKVQK